MKLLNPCVSLTKLLVQVCDRFRFGRTLFWTWYASGVSLGKGTLRLFLNTLLLMSFLLDFGIFSSSLSTPFSQHYALGHLTRHAIYHILLDIGLVKIFKLQMNYLTHRCWIDLTGNNELYNSIKSTWHNHNDDDSKMDKNVNLEIRAIQAKIRT